MSIQEHVIFEKSGDAVFRVVDGEAVIVEPKTGMVNVLNDPGTRIWELLDGQKSIRVITDIIQDEYDAPAGQALADTVDFLQDMMEKELVVMRVS